MSGSAIEGAVMNVYRHTAIPRGSPENVYRLNRCCELDLKISLQQACLPDRTPWEIHIVSNMTKTLKSLQ